MCLRSAARSTATVCAGVQVGAERQRRARYVVHDLRRFRQRFRLGFRHRRTRRRRWCAAVVAERLPQEVNAVGRPTGPQPARQVRAGPRRSDREAPSWCAGRHPITARVRPPARLEVVDQVRRSSGRSATASCAAGRADAGPIRMPRPVALVGLFDAVLGGDGVGGADRAKRPVPFVVGRRRRWLWRSRACSTDVASPAAGHTCRTGHRRVRRSTP